MLRTTSRLVPIAFSAVFPFQQTNPNDKITQLPVTKVDGQPVEFTGFDRVRSLFQIDEFGMISPQLNFVGQSAFLSAFVGAAYGGFVKSKEAYANFIANNQATAFENTFAAKKKLQDTVTIAFGKGAFDLSWRLSFFTGSYTLIVTVIAFYRGKSSILEYMVAGAITGGLYKLNLGLRATGVGALVGVVLGTIAGAASLTILKLSGVSIDEIHYWQNKYQSQRQKMHNKLMESVSKEANDPVLKIHDARLEHEKMEEPK